MTPIQNINQSAPLTDQDTQKVTDLNFSSHYHRFKRNSVGYQSQGPHIYGSGNRRESLLQIEVGGGLANGMVREPSQTAFGVGQFPNNGRSKQQPPAILFNQAADSEHFQLPMQIEINSSQGNPMSQQTSAISVQPLKAVALPVLGIHQGAKQSPAERFRRNLSLKQASSAQDQQTQQQFIQALQSAETLNSTHNQNVMMLQGGNRSLSPYHKIVSAQQSKVSGIGQDSVPSMMEENKSQQSQPVRIQDFILQMRAQKN